ncbi:MAG TPA: hypothetical protein VFQ65_19185 [Kofleriaceae bacterium]|nr:hypothetical protein [Kofleriaceae bacterium]
MLIRTWLLAAICASCAAPASAGPANHVAATPAAQAKAVTVPPFGDVTIEDGALVLMDRGNGDKRVHYMHISRDYHGTTLSHDDVAGAEPRRDTFPIDGDERGWIKNWSDQLWRLAPHGRKSYAKVKPASGDFFEWAIVLRRGNEVRVIEGGANASDKDPQPDLLEGPLDFLDMHF